MKKKFPETLILIHKGYSEYLPAALYNARRNFNGKVFLIGDGLSGLLAGFFNIEAYSVVKFSKEADEFEKIYSHHSTLGREFELFCMQRWFILHAFLKSTGLSSCVCMDTDNLITGNFHESIGRFDERKIYFTGTSAHVCLIRDRNALRQFLDYVIDVYSERENEKTLGSWYDHMIQTYGAGGVSDMTLFQWFLRDHPATIGRFSDGGKGVYVEESLSETDGFKVSSRGFKELYWVDRIPHVKTVDDFKLECINLHHQGRAKRVLWENLQMLHGNLLHLTITSSVVWFSYRLVRYLKKLGIKIFFRP